MYYAYATNQGWEVYRPGKRIPLAVFERLESVKKIVEEMGCHLAVIIDGYRVN